jgi:hypothetical protein
MSLMLLTALLVLVGPFLVVSPLALIARQAFSPPARRRPPMSWHLPSIRLEVAW